MFNRYIGNKSEIKQKVHLTLVVFLYRMGTHRGILLSNKRIENAPSSFRTIREAQTTRKMMTGLSFNTVRKSQSLPPFHEAAQYVFIHYSLLFTLRCEKVKC